MSLVVILVITNFLRTLFIILVIWYGIKLITKYVFPFIVNKTVRNMQSHMEDQIRQKQRSQRSEGEVTIERNQKNGTKKYNEGEYIDFEEVE